MDSIIINCSNLKLLIVDKKIIKKNNDGVTLVELETTRPPEELFYFNNAQSTNL
ncbi:hypothetical protein [Flagellimonas onchidii]|uniref:hypothetical protein n=1 Tax=Flagellimonas onchidii TaxID=2562684 RepID=UPI0014560288|nr:hypothetical protein [Allomuricauda onchidii]